MRKGRVGRSFGVCCSTEFNKMAKGFIQEAGIVILKIKKGVQDGGNI
jgi:hypothetical protein